MIILVISCAYVTMMEANSIHTTEMIYLVAAASLSLIIRIFINTEMEFRKYRNTQHLES